MKITCQQCNSERFMELYEFVDMGDVTQKSVYTVCAICGEELITDTIPTTYTIRKFKTEVNL